MLCISVALLSGRTARVRLAPDCTVQELRRRAQEALGVHLDRLFKHAKTLQNNTTLNDAGLQDGDLVVGRVRQTLIASYLESCASPVRSFTLEDMWSPYDALAVRWDDGSVLMSSNEEVKTSVSACASQGVQQLAASSKAFAAILEDGHGSVVAWGDPSAGGDIDIAAMEELEGVHMLSSTHCAFAALRSNGHVVAWGDPLFGGDCGPVSSQLYNVRAVQSNVSAFAALRQDGKVITWGNPEDGGNLQLQLQDVTQIYAANHAFAAVRADRSLIAWGSKFYGGDITSGSSRIEEVLSVHASGNAFAAIRADSSAVAWGCPRSGGSTRGVEE